MEATPTQIINYFSGFKQNLVPLFQRPYTWGERQWRTLWEDLVSFYGSGLEKSTHFMGAVVTMPARSVPVGVSKFLVIDGQQRLTTIAILLCAIRDELNSSDSAPKRRIQNFYLTNDGFEGLDFSSFSRPRATGRHFLRSFKTPEPSFPIHSSRSRTTSFAVG